jgi:iron complex outermembrane receptor protein
MPTGTGGISTKSPQSIYVIANLINLGGQKINSTDINIDYTKKVADVGTFDLTSIWTWYNNYQLQLIPTQSYYEYAGTASQNEGTIPKWRTYTTLDWKNWGFDAYAGVTYVDSVNDWVVGGKGAKITGTIPSFTAFDLGLSYDFGHLHLHKALEGLTIKVGVNNLSDKQPPLAPDVFPNTNADVGTYDGAIGRMWYFEAKYAF